MRWAPTGRNSWPTPRGWSWREGWRGKDDRGKNLFFRKLGHGDGLFKLHQALGQL